MRMIKHKDKQRKTHRWNKHRYREEYEENADRGRNKQNESSIGKTLTHMENRPPEITKPTKKDKTVKQINKQA